MIIMMINRLFLKVFVTIGLTDKMSLVNGVGLQYIWLVKEIGGSP